MDTKEMILEVEKQFIRDFYKPKTKLQKITEFISDIITVIIGIGTIIIIILMVIIIFCFALFIIFSSASFGWHLFA